MMKSERQGTPTNSVTIVADQTYTHQFEAIEATQNFTVNLSGLTREGQTLYILFSNVSTMPYVVTWGTGFIAQAATLTSFAGRKQVVQFIGYNGSYYQI